MVGLIPLRVFGLKRSTAAAFTVTFSVLSQKKSMLFNVLFENWFLLGVKITSSQAHKTESWYLLGVHFKISDDHPCPFNMGVPPVNRFHLRSSLKSGQSLYVTVSLPINLRHDHRMNKLL